MTLKIAAAERAELPELKDWTASAFGDLIPDLEEWLTIERNYIAGLDALLAKREHRRKCSLTTLEVVWCNNLKDLALERSARNDALLKIEKQFHACSKLEETRLKDVSRVFKRLDTRYENYNTVHEEVQSCVRRVEEVRRAQAEPVRASKFSQLTGRTKSQPAEDPATVEKKLYDLDKMSRKTAFTLNRYRLGFQKDLKELILQEHAIGEGLAQVFRTIGEKKQIVGQLLNSQGSFQINQTHYIKALGDVETRKEASEEKLAGTLTTVLKYENPWLKAPSQCLIFGIPLPEQPGATRTSFNPDPWDVLRVLVRATRRKKVPIGSSRPGSASSPSASSASLQLLSGEALHNLEHNWNKSSSYELVKGCGVEPYKILAHFFAMLPDPFITIDDALHNRIKAAKRWEVNLPLLEEVWKNAGGEVQQEILVQLCEMFETVPAEAAKWFAEPLTHIPESQIAPGTMVYKPVEVMFSTLFMSWRQSSIAIEALNRLKAKSEAARIQIDQRPVPSSYGSSSSHIGHDLHQPITYQERTLTSSSGIDPRQIPSNSNSAPDSPVRSTSTTSQSEGHSIPYTQAISIPSYPRSLAPSLTMHLSVSPPTPSYMKSSPARSQDGTSILRGPRPRYSTLGSNTGRSLVVHGLTESPTSLPCALPSES